MSVVAGAARSGGGAGGGGRRDRRRHPEARGAQGSSGLLRPGGAELVGVDHQRDLGTLRGPEQRTQLRAPRRAHHPGLQHGLGTHEPEPGAVAVPADAGRGAEERHPDLRERGGVEGITRRGYDGQHRRREVGDRHARDVGILDHASGDPAACIGPGETGLRAEVGAHRTGIAGDDATHRDGGAGDAVDSGGRRDGRRRDRRGRRLRGASRRRDQREPADERRDDRDADTPPGAQRATSPSRCGRTCTAPSPRTRCRCCRPARRTASAWSARRGTGSGPPCPPPRR